MLKKLFFIAGLALAGVSGSLGAIPNAPVLTAQAQIYGGVINAQWDGAAYNGVDIGAYFLEADTGASFTQRQILSGGATGGSFSVACAVSAVVRVRAQDADGFFGPYSLTVAASVPCAPIIQSATISGGQLTLSWVAPTAQIQGLGSAYVACTNVAGLSDAQFSALPSGLPTGSSVLIPNPNESWWYRVYEVDAAGAISAASAEIAVMPPPVISAVRPKAAAVYLRWLSTLSATAPNVTGYAVYYDTVPVTSSSPSMAVSEPGIGNFAAVTLTGLTDGEDYYFGVAARGGGQEGSIKALTYTVRASYPNPVITSLKQTLGGPVTLAWNTADLSGGTLSSYMVYRATDQALATGLSLSATSLGVKTAAVTPTSAVSGVTDYYYIVAQDILGAFSNLTPSAQYYVSVSELAQPAMPTAVTGNARVVLSWLAVPGANQYQVFRSSSATYPIAPLVDGLTTGLNYTDSNPYNGQTNFYQVTARQTLSLPGSYVESTPSASVSAMPFINPGMPGYNSNTRTSSVNYYLTVTAESMSQQTGQSSVILKWAKAPAGSQLVTGYQAYQGAIGSDAPLGASFTALSENLGSLTVTGYPLAVTAPGLDIGGIYTFSISANDADGNTGPRLIRTVSLIYPNAPTLSNAYSMSPTAGKATLTWIAPSSQPNPVTAYDIYASPSPNIRGDLLASVTVTSFVDASQSGTVYYQYYRVYARDNLGLVDSNGTNYMMVGVTLRAAPVIGGAPSFVSQVAATSLAGSEVLIQWTPNPPGENVIGYNVYRGALPLGQTSQLQFTDTSVPYGSSYIYQVQAQNSFDVGVSGTAASLMHLPPAPTGLKLIVDPVGAPSRGLTLSWDAMGVDSYTLYRSLGPFTTVDAASAIPGILTTTYTDTPTTLDQSYEYRIASFSSGLVGPPSATGQTFVSVNPPATPTALVATPLSSGGAISLTWNGVTITADKFLVYRATSALSTTPAQGLSLTALSANPSGFNTFTDNFAQAGTAYYYGVAALDYNGRGLAVTTSAVTALVGTPYNLTAVATVSGSNPAVKLTWTVPASTYAQGTYDLYGDTSPAFNSPPITLATGLTVSNPPQTVIFTNVTGTVNTPLYYRVQATGGSSNIAEVVVHDKPTSLAASLVAKAVAGGVSLAWAPSPASEAVTGYLIYYEHSGVPLGLSTTVGLTTSFGIGGVAASDQVTATVQALNSWGLSDVATVSARANLAAGAFSPLSFTVKAGFVESVAGTSHLNLSWTKAGVANAFEIYRDINPISLIQAAGGSASSLWQKEVAGSVSVVADTSVVASTDYYYALTAVSPTGLPGGESYPVFFGPVKPFNYPSLVSFTVAVGGDSRVDLAWATPVNSGTAGLATVPYTIYRYAYPGPSAPAFKSQLPDTGFPVTTTSNAFTDLNVVNGSRYLYYVSVTDSQLREQEQPDFVSLTPSGPAKPPLHLNFFPGDGQVTVIWLAQQIDNSKYNVYRRDAGALTYTALPLLREVGPSAYNSGTQVVETLIDTTAINKNSYCYTMAAVNVVGEGPKSEEFCVTPFKPLDPSTSPIVTLLVVNRKDVRLSWNLCASQSGTGGYDLKDYKIYRSEDGGSIFKVITQTVQTTFQDIDTHFGFTYVYRVVPVDMNGNEGISYHVVIVSIPAPINNVLIFKNSFNPDKGETVPIQYVLLTPGHAWVKIFTLQGEYVATLFEEDTPSNTSADSPYLSDKKTWDGRNALGQVVASGVYLVHLEANGFRANGRVAVIK